jgi:hypothetical protein
LMKIKHCTSKIKLTLKSGATWRPTTADARAINSGGISTANLNIATVFFIPVAEAMLIVSKVTKPVQRYAERLLGLPKQQHQSHIDSHQRGRTIQVSN